MDAEHLLALKRKPFALIFPDQIKDIEKGLCPQCRSPIDEEDFTALELREYYISGMCKRCQCMAFDDD